jgi:Uncharacterised nucleotidyltransferase
MSDLKASPLLAALSPVDSDASAAWKAWRSSVDIQHLTWPDMQILPILNGPRLEGWLADDPAAGILKGIVRRVWSEAQVRLGVAVEVTNCLRQTGCDSVTHIGALGAYLRSLQSTAIRPVLELRLLIPRGQLSVAKAALEAEGWQLRDRLPTGEWLNRMTHLFFTRNGMRLQLYWRLLRVSGRRAAACEREFLSEYRTVEAAGTRVRILSLPHALLEALAVPEESVDALAWQADAALILQPTDDHDTAVREIIRWQRWAQIAACYQPEAFNRLPELREMGLPIPALRAPIGLAGWMQYSHTAEVWRHAAAGWARRLSAAVGRH